MRRRKIFIIISILCCCLGIVATIGVKFSQTGHKHELTEARVYHISQEGIYYTRSCNDGYSQVFSTGASLLEVMKTVTEQDRIILDEDIVLDRDIIIKSSSDTQPIGFNLDINLDLNNHQISSDVGSIGGAMFKLNADLGTIKLNVKNGKLYSEDFQYIFGFQTGVNFNQATRNVILNLDNVECVVKGNNATPLFVNNSASNIEVVANNCTFEAQELSTESANAVGAYINAQDSRFYFTGCDFKGIDALYVKQGRVNLNNCKLNTESGSARTLQQTQNPFYAIGSALLLESHNSNAGCTQFNVIITGCDLQSLGASLIKMIQTTSDGVSSSVNNSSHIVVNSARFIGGSVTESINEDVITCTNAPVFEMEGDKPMFVVK